MFNSNCGASVPLVANIDGNNGNGMFGGDGLWGLNHHSRSFGLGW